MDNPGFIRSLYHPQQPTEDSLGKGKLFYKEHTPCIHLQPYVHCFWELKTNEPLLTTYNYRVVTDGCVDLVIDCQSFNGMQIAGIADTSFEVPMDGTVSYFGIRFLPASIHYFLKFPVHTILNQMLSVDNLPDRSLDKLAELVFEKTDLAARIMVAESFLLTLLSKRNAEIHPGLARALHHILSTGGDVSIQTKAAEWISPRQLRRLFHDHVGCSPKLFARIARFQKTLYTMRYGNSAERVNPFYQHGYFDQAHFIKEFKLLYGSTPALSEKKDIDNL
jgi:AraC-like DNA-binding protein